MSLILNGTTLKQPSSVTRNDIEIAKDHVTLDGISKRDIVRQKQSYTMVFSLLTTSEISDIMTIFNLKQAVTMVFSELSINTTVWVRIQQRIFEARGTDYRETITLLLEEV